MHELAGIMTTGIDWNTDGHLPFDIIGELFLGSHCSCCMAPSHTNIIYDPIGNATIQFTNEIDPSDIIKAVKEVAN